MGERHEGTVKWFNNKKGYGFIEGNNGSEIFVHYSEIKIDGFKTLQEGEAVTFEIAQGPKGDFAKDVARNNTEA